MVAHLTNSGTVETSGSNGLTIQSTNGALIVVNNSGATLAASGALTIQNTSSSSSGAISISGTGAFTAGSNITVNTTATNTVTFASNVSFTPGGSSHTLTIDASVIDLGSHTVSNATSGSQFVVDSPTGGLTIEGGSGGTGILLSNAAPLSITPTGFIDFSIRRCIRSNHCP